MALMAVMTNQATPPIPQPPLAASAHANGENPTQALAKKLIGDPGRYRHLVTGRGSKRNAQILDLNPLREALGASWSSYGELVHRIATRILLRHLGGAYDYERYAECYVVGFRDLPEHQARAHMARIATALAEFLFGTGTSDPEPMAGRGRFDGRGRSGPGAFSGIGNAFGRLFRSIGNFMAIEPDDDDDSDGARAATAPAAAKSARAASGANTTLRGATPIAAPAAKAAAAAGKTPAATKPPATAAAAVAAGAGSTPATPPAEPAWARQKSTPTPTRRGVFDASAARAQAPAPRARDKAAVADPAVTTAVTAATAAAAPSAPGEGAQHAALQELAKRAAQNETKRAATAVKPTAPAAANGPAVEAVAKPAPPTAFTVDKLSFVYRPMWSVRTNMLAIASCCAAGKLPNGELAIGESVLPPAATLEVIEQVDRTALQHVLDNCLPHMESGRGALIAVPVHYETLLDRERRTAYLNICRSLSMTARKRLIFECRNIDGDPNHGALISNLMQLKPYATLLIGMLPLRTSNFALWKRAGLGSVGVDVTTSPGSESEIIEGLHHFALQAGQSGLRATAANLGTLSLAAAAVTAGFDFIEGGVIQNQLRPADVRPFTLEDLYLQYAVARRAKVGPARLLDSNAGTEGQAPLPVAATRAP